MRKLLTEREILRESFGRGNDGYNTEIFKEAVVWAEEKLQLKFISFGQWLANNCMPISHEYGLAYWIKLDDPKEEHFSTCELFDLFIDSLN